MVKAQRFFVITTTVSLGIATTVVFAPTAAADCTEAGGVTVCAQGQVRGSNGAPDGSTGPYYPYPCEYDWYCIDGGVDVILDVDKPDGDFGRPGQPGARPDNSLPGGGRGGGGGGRGGGGGGRR